MVHGRADGRKRKFCFFCLRAKHKRTGMPVGPVLPVEVRDTLSSGICAECYPRAMAAARGGPPRMAVVA